MKFFQKTWVAWLCTAAMIGAAVVIGLNKESAAVPEPGEVGLDTSLSTAQFADYIWDQAGVLSDSQERDICLYNANWVQRYDSLIALAVVDGVSGDIGDYAYSLGEEIELASSDGILVIDVKNTNGYLAVGPDYPMTDQQVTKTIWTSPSMSMWRRESTEKGCSTSLPTSTSSMWTTTAWAIWTTPITMAAPRGPGGW